MNGRSPVLTGLLTPRSSTDLVSEREDAKLGLKDGTREYLRIGDTERCSGMYVVGRSGTGKTTFLKNLIGGDIKKGHGVFFIDPHGEAIDDLVNSGNEYERLKDDLILLDPTSETHSFALNPLACRDVSSRNERTAAYTKTYRVFQKLFEDERGTWGVWLQLFLQNTISAFIENPELTLADMPLFFSPDNSAFRQNVIGNIRHETRVAEFWREEFSRPAREQRERLDALRTRLEILLARHVRDIIGQRESTIDFADLMAKRRSLFLKLPARLPPDSKKIIGTLFLSELVYAAQNRPVSARPLFCVCIDEFQHFALSDDFAVLFTEARKYGIATTVAHQERYGQLGQNAKILGATDAAGNKVFFQLAPRDAAEKAPEVAREPPKEIRREQQFVLSQSPVADLLEGHTNPQIHAFVRTYLRRLQERLEDIKDSAEGERLSRMELLDEVAIDRRGEQGSAFHGVGYQLDYLLQPIGRALVQARQKTETLISLHEQAQSLRQTLRFLDRFLTAVMEGRITPGEEEFANFLLRLVGNFSSVPAQYAETLSLYILLSYGDPNRSRIVPFALAAGCGLFRSEVALLTRKAQEQTRLARQAFEVEYRRKLADEWKTYYNWYIKAGYREYPQMIALADERISETNLSSSWHSEEQDVRDRYRNYVWYRCEPGIRKLLAPYLRRTYPTRISDQTIAAVKQSFYYSEFLDSWLRCRLHRKSVVEDLVWFLQTYRTGAEYALQLIGAAHKASELKYPDIPGEEKLNTLWVIKALNDILRPRWREKISREELAIFASWFTLYGEGSKGIFADIADSPLGQLFRRSPPKVVYDERLMGEVEWWLPREPFCFEQYEQRNGVKALRETLRERWGWFSRQHPQAAASWSDLPEFTRTYLLLRAYRFVRYGSKSADTHFPQPSFLVAKEVVTALISLITDTDAAVIRAIEQERERLRGPPWREKKERECAQKLAEIVVLPPAALGSRVLTAQEIREVREACLRVLRQSAWNAQSVLTVIEDFVEFCRLLSLPENLIERPTRQYIKREVNLYTTAEMVNQMAQELQDLPIFHAYVKIRTRGPEGPGLWKGRIQTLPPPSRNEQLFARNPGLNILQEAIGRSERLYCREQSAIDREIGTRQDRWRQSPGRFAQARTNPALAKASPGVSRFRPPPPTAERSQGVTEAAGLPELPTEATLDLWKAQTGRLLAKHRGREGAAFLARLGLDVTRDAAADTLYALFFTRAGGYGDICYFTQRIIEIYTKEEIYEHLGVIGDLAQTYGQEGFLAAHILLTAYLSGNDPFRRQRSRSPLTKR